MQSIKEPHVELESEFVSVIITSRMKQPSARVSRGFESAIMHKQALEQRFRHRNAGVMLEGIVCLFLLLRQPCSEQLRDLQALSLQLQLFAFITHTVFTCITKPTGRSCNCRQLMHKTMHRTA